MPAPRIAEALAGPLQAVVSVSRPDRGPLSVPISYWFDGARFLMVTSPESQHGRLMAREGRATITVQYERCEGATVHQWYVTAEGPVAFTDDDPAPVVRSILAKDRGEEHAEAWLGEGPSPGTVRVAVLTPERIGGYEHRERLHP